MFEHPQHHSEGRLPPHRADVAPGHFPEAEQEPFPDHPGQLVLGDWDKPECLVETDELQGRVHVEHLVPARVDQGLHHEPGKTAPTELFKGEDPVDLMPVLVQPAPGNRGEPPVDKCAENPVLSKVGLLLVIVVPDFFNEGEFGVGKFTGQGGWGSW